MVMMSIAPLTFVSLFALTQSCFSQGAVNFSNIGGGPAGYVNAPFHDDVNAYSGTQFAAQLYWGPVGVWDPRLLTTDGVSGSPAPFLTENKVGYFVGHSRSISGAPGGSTVSLQVRVWATATGSSWENATTRAESNIIQVTLGTLPAPPPNMVGLSTFQFSAVPEPSSIALGLLGLGALVLIRRRSAQRLLLRQI